MLDELPRSQDVEAAAAILRGEAAKLAVWREGHRTKEQLGHVEYARWEAPNGGPPAPGAAEQAQGLLKVADTLEGLREPLRAFEAHQESGGTPYEFLMLMMSDSSAILSDADQTTPQEG